MHQPKFVVVWYQLVAVPECTELGLAVAPVYDELVAVEVGSCGWVANGPSKLLNVLTFRNRGVVFFCHLHVLSFPLRNAYPILG